jgi:cytoskeletal protein CcmA (bactofilin family)
LGFLRKAISASHGNNSVTIVPTGARLVGELQIDGSLHVNGEFDGLLDTQANLIVGRTGVCRGRARAHEVMLTGQYDGELHCDRLHIYKGGVFRGRVACEQLQIEEQGEFLGERIYPGLEATVIEEVHELLEQPLPMRDSKEAEVTLDNLLDSLPTQIKLKD